MAASGHRVIGGSRHGMIFMVGLATLAGTCAGCQGGFDKAGTAQGQPLVKEFRAKDENPFWFESKEQPASEQAIMLRAYRILLTDSGSIAERLWQSLPPGQLVGQDAGQLSRNGLAVAVGDESAWPKVLEDLGLADEAQPVPTITRAGNRNQATRIETYLPEGLEAELPLGGPPGNLTLSWSEPGQELLNKTYKNCQKILLASTAAGPTGRVKLKLVPALKERASSLGALNDPADQTGQLGPQYAAKFESLTVEILVSPNEFLLLGGSGQTGQNSFGTEFFQQHTPDGPKQVLFLVIPRAGVYTPGQGFSEPRNQAQEK